MAKIIVFDANETTIELIKYAKSQGHYVISCDNKPDNAGHKYSNENLFISTYDLGALRKNLADKKIDAAIFFASSHGVYAASNLSDLFRYSYLDKKATETISDKHKFRGLLNELNINCPKYCIVTKNDEIDNVEIELPVIVKPVDCGGNVGITKVTEKEKLRDAILYALEKSSKKIAIVETFIETELQINGDCVIFDGKIRYAFLGKHIYANEKTVVPYSTMFGGEIVPANIEKEIINQVELISKKVGISRGVFNVEFRIGVDGKAYCIEINTRHSGNRIYQLMSDASKVSMDKISVNLALNDDVSKCNFKKTDRYYAYVILFSDKAGTFESVEISEDLDKYVLSKYVFKKNGDKLNEFRCLSDRVGLINLSFPDKQTMEKIVYNIKNYYDIRMK